MQLNVIKNMKYTKKIIGLTIILSLVSNAGAPISYAQEAALTKPEIACKAKKKILDKAYELEAWGKADPKDQSDYKIAFEEMQEAHHDYVGCIFDFAEKEIMKSDGADSGGSMAANLTSLSAVPVLGSAIDWMASDQACLTNEELKEIIQNTEPSQMLKPILDAHNAYKENLNEIGKDFYLASTITNEKGEPLTGIQLLTAKSASTIERQRQMEIDSSLMAIDLMFHSLKELRLAFVMHVHFQCTLKFLDQYRRALENLRNVIEPLPIQLEDASIS